MTQGDSRGPAETAACPPKTPAAEAAVAPTSRGDALADNMRRIGRKVLVLSGKGGVGKSTVAANLAVALALAGRRVGLLDVDLHGPSIPKLLGLENERVEVADGAILPVVHETGLRVMSLGFMLGSRDEPVVWRGPMKMKVIEQFLRETAWGELDDLVIDFPPGTGDEPLSVAQLVENVTGAVIVTTPQDLAVADVRRCIGFCRALSLPVLGVVENMSGWVCPHCGRTTDIFKTGGGERMARETGVPFLGRVPLDAAFTTSGDAGRPVVLEDPASPAAEAFRRIVERLLASDADTYQDKPVRKEKGPMRIAIPMADGRLAMHFGHCQEFALVDVDVEKGSITGQTAEAAPDHQPGLLPKWLAERGAEVIIAGGMGRRAQDLFA
ncbi:MAG TPA: iron-sulfur cluster carrier protein MrpORP, partial [Planctomycetota bacterium]|nr:iron-sulfur cluster carrier protein MrpORP [Planctomycetota bacterium]